MEKEFCTVQTGDKVKCYERGIAYKKIAEEFQEEYPAKNRTGIGGRDTSQELNKRLKQDCKIEFVTVKDRSVMRLIVEVSVLCLSKQFMMSEDMTRSAM